MITVWLQNEKPDWSRYTDLLELIRRKADGRIRRLPARTTLHAWAGAEVAWEEFSFSRGTDRLGRPLIGASSERPSVLMAGPRRSYVVD
jgi:hypothetical protein